MVNHLGDQMTKSARIDKFILHLNPVKCLVNIGPNRSIGQAKEKIKKPSNAKNFRLVMQYT